MVIPSSSMEPPGLDWKFCGGNTRMLMIRCARFDAMYVQKSAGALVELSWDQVGDPGDCVARMKFPSCDIILDEDNITRIIRGGNTPTSNGCMAYVMFPDVGTSMLFIMGLTGHESIEEVSCKARDVGMTLDEWTG